MMRLVAMDEPGSLVVMMIVRMTGVMIGMIGQIHEDVKEGVVMIDARLTKTQSVLNHEVE